VWFGETVVDWLLVAVMLAWLMMASGVIPAGDLSRGESRRRRPG
jgi:hypothetical protein